MNALFESGSCRYYFSMIKIPPKNCASDVEKLWANTLLTNLLSWSVKDSISFVFEFLSGENLSSGFQTGFTDTEDGSRLEMLD